MTDYFPQEMLQVYFDCGDGFSEGNSRLFQMSHREGWEIEKEILLPEGVKSLRLDPGYRACMTSSGGLLLTDRPVRRCDAGEGKFDGKLALFRGRMIRTFLSDGDS